MNASSPEKLKPASEFQCELLYATPRYQVRLWHLTPSTVMSGFPCALADSETIQSSQCLVVSGDLSIFNGKDERSPKKGERFILNGEENWCLTPRSNVLLLELRWGENLEAKPLHEITEERPWGSFTVLKDEPAYKMKQLSVKPGNRLSLQRHFKREEHWLITQGQPVVELNEAAHHLQPGGYIHIPLQGWHRVSNPEGAQEPVEIIELQLGDYFGEDDIERRQDDYGRQ